MSDAIKVLVQREWDGWSAGTPADLNFLVFASTRADVVFHIEGMVKLYFGARAAYTIVEPKLH